MTLNDYLCFSAEKCRECFSKADTSMIRPEELRLGTVEYFNRGGKRLRPAILMLSAGAVGGAEAEHAVVSAACAVELFHTFTLIHDDIIDNDATRRGGKSVHVMVSDIFENTCPDKKRRDEYGRDTAILAGDMLHALAVSLMLDSSKIPRFSPKTVIEITRLLETSCLAAILEGEAVDTAEGLLKNDSLPFSPGSFDTTLNIMEKKTGALFEWPARFGAMLGLDTCDPHAPTVDALGSFASLCGIAFQIQDDILGICADEKKLGKPVGSDIREGKHTFILQKAYERANAYQRSVIERVVGNHLCSVTEIEQVTKIFIDTEAVEYAKSLAKKYIKKAVECLDTLPSSDYKNILNEWADFMSERSL